MNQLVYRQDFRIKVFRRAFNAIDLHQDTLAGGGNIAVAPAQQLGYLGGSEVGTYQQADLILRGIHRMARRVEGAEERGDMLVDHALQLLHVGQRSFLLRTLGEKRSQMLDNG